MKKQWIKNGHRLINDHKRILAEACPCLAWVTTFKRRDNNPVPPLSASDDAIEWTSYYIDGYDDAQANDIAYNGSVWVAGGSPFGLAYSLNGIDWIRATSIISSIDAVAWNGSYFLAVLSGSKIKLFSEDGINWTYTYSDIYTYFTQLYWDGTSWFGTGYYAGTKLYKSSDGINWTTISTPFDASNKGNHGIAFNGSLYVLVGTGYEDSGIKYCHATSPDGINWTPRSNPVHATIANGIGWNGNLWVSTHPGHLCSSPDGINWTDRENTYLIDRVDVVWNGKLWAVCGNGTNTGTNKHNLLISPDGVNWTKILLPGSIVATGIASTTAPNLYPPIGV